MSAKKVKTIKGNKTFKWTKNGLKAKKGYKAVVKAYTIKNGKKTYVRTGPMVHAYTSGGTSKYTNAKRVTVKKASVSLKAGKTYKIKAKDKGSCKVYVIAVNGASKAVRVTVK